MAALPSLFIGSSSESLEVAEAFQAQLERYAEVTIWNQGVFTPGKSFLEALVDATERFDFAMMIADAVDRVESRGQMSPAPRDNVMFELGLFMGALGRQRVVLVYNRDNRPALPSDLAGVTCLTYPTRSDDNLRAAINPAATELRRLVERLGFRDMHRMDRMEQQVEHMVRLLVRSRKVEIDLIAKQFAPMIQPDFLAQMRQDFADLEESLSLAKQNRDV